MDVDSDDDEEIIAERGTIVYSIIFLFFHDARVYTSFSLIITFDDDERKGGDLRETTDNAGQNKILTLF